MIRHYICLRGETHKNIEFEPSDRLDDIASMMHITVDELIVKIQELYKQDQEEHKHGKVCAEIKVDGDQLQEMVDKAVEQFKKDYINDQIKAFNDGVDCMGR